MHRSFREFALSGFARETPRPAIASPGRVGHVADATGSYSGLSLFAAQNTANFRARQVNHAVTVITIRHRMAR
jgi:hypothetical protein